MSFIKRYSNTITFSKEFLENDTTYIYSIYHYNDRVRSYFTIIKTDIADNVIWSKNYADLTRADEHFEMVQIPPVATRDNDEPQNNIVSQPAEDLNNVFYGQYLIISKSSSKDNLDRLVINPDGSVSSSTSSFSHINPGLHNQKMVSNNNYIIILSSEVDSTTNVEFQKLFISSSVNGSNKILNLRNIINANDVVIVANIIYLVGNYNNLAALVALDAASGNIVQSYTSDLSQSLVDVEMIKNNTDGRLAIKLRLGDGSYALGLNRVVDALSSNQNLLPASFDYLLVGNDIPAFCLTPDAIYFTQDCSVSKSNFDLDTIWKKKIDIDNSENLLISAISFSDASEFLTLSIVNQYPITNPISFLVYADREVSTCKTIPQNTESFIKLFANYSQYRVSRPSITTPTITWHTFTASDVAVDFANLCGGSVEDGSILQSSAIYLQAAGSTGTDSTAGIHLRWLLKGPLENHLPKGDYYQAAPVGLNRPDDYVKIMKAPYIPVIITLDLTIPPNATVDGGAVWLYEIGKRKFYVYFRNLTKYQQVRSFVDPLQNPRGFIQEYSSNLIEVEIKQELFFSSKIYVNGEGSVKTEILSVESNEMNLPKNISFRKNISYDSLQQIYAENGRSIRFAAYDCSVIAIDFEFYGDFISEANSMGRWSDVGRYSLSTNDQEVFSLLDPDPDDHPIHATWPRYNEGEFVNIDNYKIKWNGNIDDPRNLIKHSVEKYLFLSNDGTDPFATETYFLENEEDEVIDEDNFFKVSHLTILQMASFDYHVARMLGLGCIDFDGVLGGQKFIYAAQYVTEGDVGGGEEITTHLSISLPTSIADQRAPLPVILKEPVLGIISTDSTSDNPQTITDPEGYTYDKTSRYISLLVNELTPDEPADAPFYYSIQEFDLSRFTYPVYVGIEYKSQGDQLWKKPELANDSTYLNVNSAGQVSNNETVAIAMPIFGQPAFVHRETRSGTHVYGSYGVNWFSRARSSSQTWSVETNIRPANRLLPPSNINAILIQKESPLLFTSANEQETLQSIQNDDKTFIRLSFDYDSAQDMIRYQKAINGIELSDYDPIDDDKEVFADEVDVFFRPEIPKQVIGAIGSVNDFPGNPLVSVIQSKGFILYSTGDPNAPAPGTHQTIYPHIPAQDKGNYIGGILTAGTDDFVIQDIIIGNDNNIPVFHVLKKNVKSAFEQNSGVPFDPSSFVSPIVDQSFRVVENMLNTTSWGQLNPYQVKILIGNRDWEIHSEEITLVSGQYPDETRNTYLTKFRGVFNDAKIRQVNPSAFEGLYKITFERYTLPNHFQFSENPEEFSVQWNRGIVRIPKDSDAHGERKILKVINIENIGSGDLVIYAVDESHGTDPLFSRSGSADPIEGPFWNRKVNFYPGYRAYFYYDENFRLTYNNIYSQDENVLEKYSIFGLRSADNRTGTRDVSKISTPNLMFSRRIEEPKAPQIPIGAKYATRPDYFGRSTYSFTTKYDHRPFSVTFLRTNDDILLSSLFKQTPYGGEVEQNSVDDIRIHNNDAYINDRLLDLANIVVGPDNLFKIYNSYRLPLPNNLEFFAKINLFIDDHNKYFHTALSHIVAENVSDMASVIIPSDHGGRYGELKLLDFVKQTVQNTFVPLTEIPVIYQYIKSGDYVPVPKAQVIRDRNGNLLSPSSEEFDMSPMVKIIDSDPGEYKTLFVDFTLDGNSKSVYFYAVKETNSEMQQSELSRALGPVKLVNSYPVSTPEIKSVIPVLENEIQGIQPKMELKINSYDPIHEIKKVKLYRATKMSEALSIRTMELIKELDLEASSVIDDTIWTIEDDFSDLIEVPFGDPLFYRVTVEAKIEYAEPNFTGQPDVIIMDFAPSEPSKLMVTTITENVLPKSPELTYTGTINQDLNKISNVILHWNKQAYKAKYYLYKMNTQGNWAKIGDVQSNDDSLSLALADTDLGFGELHLFNDQGQQIYHHFKMVSENTAGMMSLEENRLTLVTDNLGISSNGTDGMIIGTTFLIR